MPDSIPDAPDVAADRAGLLDAALAHVPFDGWSPATWRAAVGEVGLDDKRAKAAAPRGALDLAAAFHLAGDEAMAAEARDRDLTAMRYSERVTHLVRARIEVAAPNKEAVRRGATLFALPIHTAEGARLIWGTADRIWRALGDTSEDYNWYSKRMILSAVYSSSVLYWLGDQSDGSARTWEYLDRRIDGVMAFEKTKARMKDNKLAQLLLAGPKMLLSPIRAPGARAGGLPVGRPGGGGPGE